MGLAILFMSLPIGVILGIIFSSVFDRAERKRVYKFQLIGFVGLLIITFIYNSFRSSSSVDEFGMLSAIVLFILGISLFIMLLVDSFRFINGSNK